MDKIFNWTSTVIGIVGGFFAAIFGQWDSILWALLVIMVLDYLTGVIKAENVAVIYPRMPQKLKDILLQLRGEDDTEE